MLILGLLLRLHSLEEKQKVSKGSPAYGVSKGQAAYAVRLRGTLTDTYAGREKQSFFLSFYGFLSFAFSEVSSRLL